MLYTYLILPLEDEKHMPPKGKSQLTAQEIAAIHYWVKKGASFVEQTETIIPQNSSTIAHLDNSYAIPALEGLSLPVNKTEETQLLETKLTEKNNEGANPAVLEKLKQQHIEVSQLGAGSNYLSANFVNVKNYTSSLIDDLKDTNGQLVRLRLSNQPVSDEDVEKIAKLKNLTRLNLENTNITDAALVHLKNLSNRFIHLTNDAI
jgi:Leucine-rich repeat (LRR) protein